MKILGGDLEPSSGNVMLEPNVRLGKLRQDQFAYEDMRVLDVVMMGHTEMWAAMSERDAIYANPEATDDDYMHAAELEAKFAEYGGYTAEARAGELLLGIGIAIEDHNGPMSNVAPGWKLRVLLAQALFSNPDVLLLDEPMSALDKQIRQRTQIELVNILDRVGVTCIMVTHDQEEAMTMADRLAVMSDGEIVQLGTPHEVYEFPNSRFSAEFIGSTNLFDGRVVEDEPDHVFVETAELPCRLYVNHGITGPLGMPVTISVRPERIALTRKPPEGAYNWGRGTVANIAYMGGYSLYHVKLDSGKTVVANVSSLALTEIESPTWGDEIYVRWSASAGVVLTA
jgi:ABC-type sugar transport system ATPase subunit